MRAKSNDKVVMAVGKFEAFATCSIRYCLGRETYMPSLIIGYLKPLLPKLTDNTLEVMERDISSAPNYGDEQIDKPCWTAFLYEIHKEIDRRNGGNND